MTAPDVIIIGSSVRGSTMAAGPSCNPALTLAALCVADYILHTQPR